MKLTRKEKDRIIKVLKEANPFVEQGYAVCESISLTNSILTDIRFAQYYIRDMIHPRFYVTGWLRQQHGIRLNEDQAIEYRKQWVDHMIKELSE